MCHLTYEREKEIRFIAGRSPPVFMVGGERAFLRAIRELLSEVDELRGEAMERSQADGKLERDIVRLQDEVRELTSVVSGLRESEASLNEAIRIYGGHAGLCDDKAPHACACGFRQVYIKATTKNKNAGTEDIIKPDQKPGGV